MTEYTVHFMPADIVIRAHAGDNLLELALEAGIHINAACGGEGSCGKCRVLISSGSVSSSACDRIPAGEFAQGWRLACRSKVNGDCTVQVPQYGLAQAPLRSERVHRQAIRHAPVLSAGSTKPDPAVQVFSVRLEPASASDNSSDLDRLQRKLRKEYGLTIVQIEHAALQNLPHASRAGNLRVSVAVAEQRIIRIEPGAAAPEHYAVAFDIGTTSLWAQLIDLLTGDTLGQCSAYNPQIAFGDDVISRIIYSRKPGGLERLQQAVVAGLCELIDQLFRNCAVDKAALTHIAAAGNTVMTHLVLGLDPRYLREAPYVPVAAAIPPCWAAPLGFAVPPATLFLPLPCIASYVGGDIVAGVVASGMHETETLTLYMDLGTNGEIVLGNRDWLMTASCSAGPAFEGGGLSCGMRAMPGAIEGFSLSADLEPMILTVDHKKPLGICGSGAINILAEFMQMGIIARNGKFSRELTCSRIRQGAGGYEYVLVESTFSGTGADVVITESDIDNILRAKAAMFAGCHALLENASLGFCDIGQVIIAGAFGDYVDLEKAVAIGLFPDIPRERYTFFGNGSLHGARLAACSQNCLSVTEATARRMTNIELSEDRSFMDKYIAGIFLPHTDLNLFPTFAARLGREAL